jgi:chemotaxis protein CheD
MTLVAPQQVEGKRVIRVGIGEMYHASPSVLLTTTVGSCIALCIYDQRQPIGGMAHIVLPTNSSRSSGGESVYKYADTAVVSLKNALMDQGAYSRSLCAKMAGGANMFAMIKSEKLQIGDKNIEATRQKLREQSIKLLAEDVAGTKGRSVKFDLATRMVCSGSISCVERWI